MGRRLGAGFVALLGLLLAVVTVAVAAVALGGLGATPTEGVSLTIFVGSVSIQRAGSAAFDAAHSGDQVGDGDTVLTGDDTKASLRYPEGTVTRLDSSTRITVSVSRTAAGGGSQVSLQQAAGLTWNRIRRLVGGSTFKVQGPNNATAEVRGTGFGYYVEHDSAGIPVIWIDVYEGVVSVTGSSGPAVATTAGQRVTVRAASAPTAPLPIPEGDKHLGFTVFNRAIEEIAGEPFAFSTGVLSPGGTPQTFSVGADGKSDLQFVLEAPPGSNFGLTVLAPDGSVFFDSSSASPPLVAFAPRARAGTWKYIVRDLRSPAQDPFWVIVGRS